MDGELDLRIFGALPPQQVQEFSCASNSTDAHDLYAGSTYRRHLCTLQKVHSSGCVSIRDKADQVLLMECTTLEVLEIDWSGRRHEECIDLEDAINFPWSYTNMRRLEPTIGVPDEPLHLHIGVEPYKKRSQPKMLSAAEIEQFAQSEAVYRQICALTDLDYLNLKILLYDPEGNRPISDDVEFNAFPGLLSICNRRYRRPNYFHHLAGLTKLKDLFGSVLAITEEIHVPMGGQ